VIPNEQFAGETLEETSIIPRSLRKAVPRVIAFYLPTVMETVLTDGSGSNREHLNRVNEVRL